MLALKDQTPVVDVIQNKKVHHAPDIQVYEVPDVSHLLKSNDNEIRHLLRTGQLRGFKVGQKWRVPHSAIIEFIERGGCL